MTDINRLKELSGIHEDNDDSRLSKIRKGISNYVRQEKDHRCPFGFEKEMAKYIAAEQDKEDPVDTIPRWGEWS